MAGLTSRVGEQSLELTSQRLLQVVGHLTAFNHISNLRMSQGRNRGGWGSRRRGIY